AVSPGTNARSHGAYPRIRILIQLQELAILPKKPEQFVFVRLHALEMRAVVQEQLRRFRWIPSPRFPSLLSFLILENSKLDEPLEQSRPHGILVVHRVQFHVYGEERPGK